MLIFILLALITLVGAVAAVTLRNLVHCALALALSFIGLAALYLRLNAQFIGFVQVLIYVGAVAILIVFAILLTRGSEPPEQPVFSASWVAGLGVTVSVFAVLGGLALSSRLFRQQTAPTSQATVRQLGEALMTRYILPLEVLGLLLTAALIGAVIIAMHEKEAK